MAKFIVKTMPPGECPQAPGWVIRASALGRSALPGSPQTSNLFKNDPNFPGFGVRQRAPAGGPRQRQTATHHRARITASKWAAAGTHGRHAPPAALRTILHIFDVPKGAMIPFEIGRGFGKLVGRHPPDIGEVVKPGAVAFADDEELRIV